MILSHEEAAEIYSLLYQLGITANYTGFFHTSYAVYLAVQQPGRLLLVTKWLYPDAAEHYKSTWKCVERNIRAVITIAWENNPALLEELAMRPLSGKPTAAQFISILARHLSWSYSPKDAA